MQFNHDFEVFKNSEGFRLGFNAVKPSEPRRGIYKGDILIEAIGRGHKGSFDNIRMRDLEGENEGN